MQCRDCNGTGVYIPRSLRTGGNEIRGGDLADGSKAAEVASPTIIQNINIEIDNKLRQITELQNKRDLATNLGIAHMPVDSIQGLAYPGSPF